MWSAYRMCRRQAYWRYVRKIVPRTAVAAPLYFGKLIHSCLETWHGTQHPTSGSPDAALDRALAVIDLAIPSHPSDTPQHATWHLARAMMRGYTTRYPEERWTVLAIEHQFDAPIINPETGKTSRSFFMGGRIDGLVAETIPELDDTERTFILEHKTAATIDANYLDRLWADFQTALYAVEIERTMNLKVTGVIYNVLAKTKLQQSQGDTEAEYQEKLAAACAKNKSGKSKLERRIAESDDEFAARLDAWYAEPTRFHRERLILGRDQLRLIEEEVWELTQQFLDCRRRDTWYQNPQACFLPGRTCPYFPICSSNGNSNVIDNLYEAKEPHEELAVEGAAGPGREREPAAQAAQAAPSFDPDWDPSTLTF
jgi:hypothetical protein